MKNGNKFCFPRKVAKFGKQLVISIPSIFYEELPKGTKLVVNIEKIK
jgi:hypothetical protein